MAFREVIRAAAAVALAWACVPAQADTAACIAPPQAHPADAIASQLPLIAVRTRQWAESQAAAGLSTGSAPSAAQVEAARAVGVKEPRRIRIVVVDAIRLPDDPLLRMAGAKAGLVSSSADGLTLGYAVFLRRGEEANPRLWRHEFRHVAQYEACGGIAPFLSAHLPHLLAVGYDRSPFERDATAHE